jgi:hypothetical protein
LPAFWKTWVSFWTIPLLRFNEKWLKQKMYFHNPEVFIHITHFLRRPIFQRKY